MLLLYFSHTHCVHDLFKHIQTEFRICKRSHTQSLHSGGFFFFDWKSLPQSHFYNKDQRRNIIGIFWENVKFSSNLYELETKIQGNKKLANCVCYNGMGQNAINIRLPLADTDPVRKRTPKNFNLFKILWRSKIGLGGWGGVV